VTLAPLRAAGRIAWRAGRRNLRRSLLVISMVALPLVLVTAVATVGRTSIPTTEDRVTAEMGRADLFATPRRTVDALSLERALPQGSQVALIRYEQSPVVASGSLFDVSLIDPGVIATDELFDGLYEVVSGRAPARPDEAAIHPDLLAALNGAVGDTVEIGDRRLTVTGIARSPANYDHHLAIVARGTLPPDAEVSAVLIDIPAEVDARSVSTRLDPRLEVVTSEEMGRFLTLSDAALFETLAIVGGALGLFATGLIAAAAFVVGARRQLRELGLVGAIGGERRHVLAVVFLGGTTLGLVGSIVGASLGIVAAYLIHPLLDDLLHHAVGPVEINYIVLLGAVRWGPALQPWPRWRPRARRRRSARSMRSLAAAALPGRRDGWQGLVC
jgi:putative ABC transport system permease protein